MVTVILFLHSVARRILIQQFSTEILITNIMRFL